MTTPHDDTTSNGKPRIDKKTRLLRKIIRSLNSNPLDGESAYFDLIDECSGEPEAYLLMVRAILDHWKVNWPDNVVRRAADFAWDHCCGKGVDVIGTTCDALTFAMDMHDWARLDDEEPYWL